MKLSDKEIILYLQCIRIKHGMTNVAFEDVIKFIALITEKSLGPLSSLYFFDKYVSKLAPSEAAEQYSFCSACYKFYMECSIPSICSCGVRILRGDNKFIYQSLKISIRTFLLTAKNREDILRFSCSTGNENMGDITDSKRYAEIRTLHKHRHGVCERNIIPFLTVCINVDGVEIFNSSSKSMYPVMITFNEVSPLIRSHNMIIPLLFTSTKSVPFHQKILLILVKELSELEIDGIEWLLEDGTPQKTLVYSATLCFDAPVKSKILGIPGHSSKNGCPIANCRGVWVPKGKGGAVVWPESVCGVARECGDTESIFDTIPALQGVVYKATAIDSLHGIYIGAVKYLFNMLFFDTKLVDKSTRDKRLEVANKVLSDVSPPFFIERLRSLTESTHFKAHEWRNILQFYSIPIFCSLVHVGLLEKKVAEHWFNLVLGVSLLNQEEISDEHILISSEALTLFVSSMGNIYGDECCTYNVHLLLHLAPSVEYLGPLWSTSMFKFEGYNRTVLNSYNGTNCVSKQIANRLSQRRSLKILHEEVERMNPMSPALDHNLFHKRPKGVKFGFPSSLEVQDMNVLREAFLDTVNFKALHSYDKVDVNSQKYTTYQYALKNSSKRTNCYVYGTKSRTFGRIKNIYYDSNRDQIIIVFECIMSSAAIKLPHSVFQCQLTEKLVCEISDSCKAAFCVPYNQGSTFSMSYRPNSYESS